VVPGVLLPDLPLRSGHPAGTRLRELVRSGLLVLAADGTPGPGELAGAARAATDAPVAVHSIAELSTELADLVDARPGEAWLVRPDGHLAAVVDTADTAALIRAIHRCLGRNQPPAPG
jgi:pentachlorophenol monooxygenase/3-(3-hydroxy-phenyl)propionate hydroxylase